MTKYWEDETPVTITTAKNVLHFYPEAMQLSVARPPWQDKNGDEKPGKTVVLNVAALLDSDIATLREARAIFYKMYTEIDERMSHE